MAKNNGLERKYNNNNNIVNVKFVLKFGKCLCMPQKSYNFAADLITNN